MTTNEALGDPMLQRILWACLACWNAEQVPIDKRSICYSWVERCHRNRFGGTFHRSKLQLLARLVLLTKDDASRGGNRRYYRISDPAQLAEFLKGSNLN